MLQQANALVKEFEKTITNPLAKGKLGKLYVGVDLGTAYIVLSVIDENGKPLAGSTRFAQVVRDGLVVDYMGAVDIVRSLKSNLAEKLGAELLTAGVAYPPGTSAGDRKAIRNVAESAMLEVVNEIDEPTAANKVLGIKNGAVVDIGGGTTLPFSKMARLYIVLTKLPAEPILVWLLPVLIKFRLTRLKELKPILQNSRI